MDSLNSTPSCNFCAHSVMSTTGWTLKNPERCELGAGIEDVGRVVGLHHGERAFPVESADELVERHTRRRLPLGEQFQRALRALFVLQTGLMGPGDRMRVGPMSGFAVSAERG